MLQRVLHRASRRGFTCFTPDCYNLDSLAEKVEYDLFTIAAMQVIASIIVHIQ